MFTLVEMLILKDQIISSVMAHSLNPLTKVKSKPKYRFYRILRKYKITVTWLGLGGSGFSSRNHAELISK
jgi:hypothetical protein